MNRKIVLLTALAASVAVASPAMAWSRWPVRAKPSTSSTSGGSSHSVPEPGMIGLMGAGLIGLGLARRRRKPKD